ncbi:MAG TPA: type II secretion system protein GspM [Gallionella sp.]|nr:type II secretion system protein GspM [Gallionella sp.]
MRTKLRRIWESRAPRERKVIAIMTMVLAAALYVWLVQSGGQAHTQLRASVTTLRGQAGRLELQAAELERLRATPTMPVSQTNLLTLVQAQTAASGLSHALVKIDAPDADRVAAVFDAVAFADWLNWVAALQSVQVRLDSCRVQVLSAPGMVSVTATLLRTKP